MNKITAEAVAIVVVVWLAAAGIIYIAAEAKQLDGISLVIILVVAYYLCRAAILGKEEE